jgi:hypothetical protein
MYGQLRFFDWQFQQKLSDSQALDLDPQNHQKDNAQLFLYQIHQCYNRLWLDLSFIHTTKIIQKLYVNKMPSQKYRKALFI